jgi:hypothetical protein
MKLLRAFGLLSVLAVSAVAGPPVVPEHRMEIHSLANPFAMQAATPVPQSEPQAGPLAGPSPVAPLSVSNPQCRVLPFLGTVWQGDNPLLGGCPPYLTTTQIQASTSYLAQWTFLVGRPGPVHPRVLGPEITDGAWNQVVSNGFQFVTYCGPEYPQTEVEWSSFSTTAVNPSSHKSEPAFVVELAAEQNGVITMTGTQVTFWNQNSILDCNPTSCRAPCQ